MTSFLTGRGSAVLIVAEIGNNHEGDFVVAQRLVEEASASGVDAVKFQTFRTEHLVSRSDVHRFAQLESFELTPQQFADLAALARLRGLHVISTPFDLHSAQALVGIVDGLKIASSDNDFMPLLDKVAQTGKPVILSTGLADLAGIRRAVDRIKGVWNREGIQSDLALLHCVSCYPVALDDANLASIPLLAREFDLLVGYSDHTAGVEAAVVAVAAGARIVEKHFTLDKEFSDFRDHRLSADPAEMKEIVTRIRAVTAMLGAGDAAPGPCERAGAEVLRRSIVAGADLPRGHRVRLEDLTWIRPGGGLAPGSEGHLLGRTLTRDVAFGERLKLSDVE